MSSGKKLAHFEVYYFWGH